jgi:hypothetical protein
MGRERVEVWSSPTVALANASLGHDLWPWERIIDGEGGQRGGRSSDDGTEEEKEKGIDGDESGRKEGDGSAVREVRDTFDSSEARLRDPSLSYRLILEGNEGGEGQGEVDAALFAHLLALSRLALVEDATLTHEEATLSTGMSRAPLVLTTSLRIVRETLLVLPSCPNLPFSSSSLPSDPLSFHLHLLLFLHQCLEDSPLQTILACRDLHLWPPLLASIGIPSSSSSSSSSSLL